MKKSSQNLPKAITLVDRISNLPDDLLCHILSFLDTEQAIATSILSKRWKFAWTYVDNLVFSDCKRGEKEQYMQFVRKVLELHKAPLIKRVEISCSGLLPTDERNYFTSIQTVLFSKNVQYLHICLFDPLDSKWRLCFFSSNTLVKLKLANPDITYIMESPKAPSFPNLKTLDLFDPRVSTDSLCRLISGCSVLEDLILHFYGKDFYKDGCCHLYYYAHYGSVEPCYISSSTLKRVELSCDFLRITINTPELEVLRIRNPVNFKFFVESSMPCLHEVHISVTLLSESSDLGFLKNFSNVSVLSFEVLGSSEYFKFALPEHFHNLTKLKIIAPWDYLDPLRFFMENSNNLQVITLEKAREYDDDEVISVIWEEPQQVPMCLLSSVRTICIKDYENEEMDLVIKYLLENAKVLEHMEIHNSEEDMSDYEVNLSNFDQKI